MPVFVVGFVDVEEDALPWQMVGVFSEEALAVAACADFRFFVGPMRLNEPAPDDPTEWPGAYYPHSDVPAAL